VEGAVSALLCRTSDRIATTAEGARSLAEALAERMGVQARLVGTPGEPADTSYDHDLRDARGCLLEAGGQVEDALAGGRFPVLTS
jgi:arginase